MLFTSSKFQVAAFRSMVNIITRYLVFTTILPNFYESLIHVDGFLYRQNLLIASLFAGYKMKHQTELNAIVILFIIWTLPSMILVGVMILCILVSAVFGEVLLAARYISEIQEIYFSLELGID